MKFKFSQNLDYQKDAIDAIVGIFDIGRNIVWTEEGFFLRSEIVAVIANSLKIDKARILWNVQAIQKTNKIAPTIPFKLPIGQGERI